MGTLSLGTDAGLCCTSCLGHSSATGSSQGAGTVRTGAGCVPQALAAPSWDRGAGAGDVCVCSSCSP